MPVLHNRISNETLKAQMLAETEPRTTISFYKYFTIVDPQATRDALWVALTQLKVFGRIYLAREGINAQISVPQSNVEALREFLYGFDPALAFSQRMPPVQYMTIFLSLWSCIISTAFGSWSRKVSAGISSAFSKWPTSYS